MSFPNQNLIKDFQLRNSPSSIIYDGSGNPIQVDYFHGIGTQTMILTYNAGNLEKTENYLNGQIYETNVFTYGSGTAGIVSIAVL